MKKTVLLFSIAIGLTGLNSCIKEDVCGDINCLNGGYCANGQCVCPEGYTGANCSQQVTPTLLRVHKIEVIQFPLTDATAGWDLTSGPDIYPALWLGNTLLWESSSLYEDAVPGPAYGFTPSPAIELTSPVSQYTIRLYDYDAIGSDDFMGGIVFTPYHSSNNFPNVLTLDAGGDVAFRLYVSYSW